MRLVSSAMAVTRDGSTVLAVVAHGEATQRGMPQRAQRWRIADALRRRGVALHS